MCTSKFYCLGILCAYTKSNGLQPRDVYECVMVYAWNLKSDLHTRAGLAIARFEQLLIPTYRPHQPDYQTLEVGIFAGLPCLDDFPCRSQPCAERPRQRGDLSQK